ncbi:cytochrome b [Orrella marina]|uniref:Cytochrome b561 bacterial/Ni-hydrogenase domain-containing protein n=1 Tax=Orrella marina TaxID=2163011 RepID=A0A2R4XMU6_9BURK|nr:cytochrome b/b6 domain-containing protein [Orrella marina]AWB35091.1 hypothetical protein DBV39_16655 [Orrella marina]
MRQFRYATSQILVHWFSALAIVFLLITGTFILAELPNTPEKVGNLRIHMLIGGFAGLLVLWRFWLRGRHPVPPPVIGHKLARIVRMAMNLGILLLVISGTVLAFQSGAFEAVFGSGSLPADFMEFLPRKVHGILTKVVMGLVALHVAGALYHQFFLRDRLMAHMGIGK